MQNSNPKIINLETYRVKGSKVFTGRDRGEYVRKQSKLDEAESESENITIQVPTDIYTINPSFLEEFLLNVVSKLGKEKFLAKFHFDNPGDYKIEKSLNEAIDRILRTKNALV